MTDFTILQDIFVSGIKRLNQGDMISYEGEPEKVFNFYINGQRIENRGNLLYRIIRVNKSKADAAKLLARK
jgi:hypothetical protein